MPGEESGAASPVVSFLTPDLEDARDNLFFQTVKFMGVLQEFTKPGVRYALQSGSICRCEDVGFILLSVDEIRRVMLPTLSGVDEVSRRDRAIAGVKFFFALLAQTDDEPLTVAGLPFPKRMTFREWFQFFSAFSSSEFWKTFSPEADAFLGRPSIELVDERSCSGLSAAFSRVDLGGESRRGDCSGRNMGAAGSGSDGRPLVGVSHPGPVMATSEQPRHLHLPKAKQRNFSSSPLPAWNHQDVKCGLGAIPKTSRGVHDNPDRSEHPQRMELAKKRARRVVLSSGSSSEESETASEISSSSSVESRSSRRSRRRSRRYPRDVVPPGLFDGLGSISMRRFLEDYEDYFSFKFDGTSRQQAKHLGEFLTGQAREAFEALDGAHMDYPRLKKKLISWYSGERVSSRQTATVEFDRAVMKPSESLTIFAMRLERLAARAFPDSKKERNRHLSRKFWACSPPTFIKAMTESRRNFAMSSGKKTLTWAAIRRLAETEDRYSKMDPDCLEDVSGGWLGRSDEAKRERAQFPRRVRYVDELGGADVVTRASCALNYGASAAERAASLDRPTCNWCGRRGHGADNCWERAGLCTLCGSGDHEKYECSRFDDTKPLFRPVCPKCEGAHLGKYCPSSQLN